jgi:hypothetical protein
VYNIPVRIKAEIIDSIALETYWLNLNGPRLAWRPNNTVTMQDDYIASVTFTKANVGFIITALVQAAISPHLQCTLTVIKVIMGLYYSPMSNLSSNESKTTTQPYQHVLVSHQVGLLMLHWRWQYTQHFG